jgi:hypothetical protein
MPALAKFSNTLAQSRFEKTLNIKRDLVEPSHSAVPMRQIVTSMGDLRDFMDNQP